MSGLSRRQISTTGQVNMTKRSRKGRIRMMKTCRRLATSAVLSAALVLAAGTAHAQTCNPGIGAAFAAHAATYTSLFTTLGPQVATLQSGLASVVDQPTYATFLSSTHTLASSIANGRLVVTVPDGTVLLDTGRPDDPTNVVAAGNSFLHFQNKTVNENHNSRIAFHDAQEWPCGVGLERKLSTSTGATETYVAIRLGTHLDSLGTARLSTR
jgi:hypothetical protein